MKAISLFLLVICISGRAISQKYNGHDILLHVDTMKVSAGEFLYELKKNNYSSDTITKQDINDYLEMYSNFKLKVRDAYARGYDTTNSFIREFNVYKNQLDDSYLTNDSLLDSLTRKVYSRLKYEIRASHILINAPESAAPSDTLKAFHKIWKIYELAKSGTPFDNLARVYSDDPTAAYNGGDIGYFTALQLVLPFENQAYKTPVGQISKPFRTRFGYHIIKVTSKKPNPGTVTVAHIMFRFSAGMSAADSMQLKNKADDLYSRLENGENWDKLCSQYSEDSNTRNAGGRLPEFGVGKMVPEFADGAFSLKNPGEISRPVQTPYGWHIIKLIDKKPLPDYNDILPELKERVKKSQRYDEVHKLYFDQLAVEYHLKIDSTVLNQCFKSADSSIFKVNWVSDAPADFQAKTLAMIRNTGFTVSDFFKYIKNKNEPFRSVTPEEYMKNLFSDYRENILTDYEKAHLGEKYPDYPWLVKEYKEGILMFDLMDTMVWEKAVNDSVGTLEFYNRNKSKYLHDETADATIVMTNDTTVLNEITSILRKSYYPVERKAFSFKIPLKNDSWRVVDSLYKQTLSKSDLYLQVKGSNANIAGFKTAAVERQQYNKPEFVYLTDNMSDSLLFQVVTSSKKEAC